MKLQLWSAKNSFKKVNLNIYYNKTKHKIFLPCVIMFSLFKTSRGFQNSSLGLFIKIFSHFEQQIMSFVEPLQIKQFESERKYLQQSEKH